MDSKAVMNARECIDSCFSLRGETGIKLKPDKLKLGVCPCRGILLCTIWFNCSRKSLDVRNKDCGDDRRKACAVLESIQNLDDLSFEDLKTKLELRLGKLSLGKVIICSLLYI